MALPGREPVLLVLRPMALVQVVVVVKLRRVTSVVCRAGRERGLDAGEPEAAPRPVGPRHVRSVWSAGRP